jgi:phosphoribosylformylglycinamidine synthase
MAGLDNFCWCDPVKSEKTPDGEYKLAQLVRANKALYDFCVAYQAPCISGKDSMKNDYSIGGSKISIPPTVLFTAVGVVPDVRQAVTADFKEPGDLIYVLGVTRDEIGASEYLASKGFIGSNVPKVLDPEKAIKSYRALYQAVRRGLVRSIHDLSDGGLGVALAESSFGGGLGARIDLEKLAYEGVERDDFVLFSETPCRFLISVKPANREFFEKCMDGFELSQIGQTTSDSILLVKGLNGLTIADIDVRELKKAWQAPLGT